MYEKGIEQVTNILQKGCIMGELGVAVGMFLGYLSTLWVSAGALGPAAGVMRGTLGGHHGVGQGSNLQLLQLGLPARCLLSCPGQDIMLQCFSHSGHHFWVIS